MPETHPQPSQRARDLVRGAFDVHVHIDPDIIPRRITDLGLAKRFSEVGLKGFVLKSHYVPTAERASVVNAASNSSAQHSVRAIGSITLNHGVGGMNASAVEIAARGCRERGARTRGSRARHEIATLGGDSNRDAGAGPRTRAGACGE